MMTNALDRAISLPDDELLERLDVLAADERTAVAELVAHLAALDSRPSLHARRGYGSLFAYCTEALRLSEDAACNRIEAARACRLFPVVLARLASGDLSLTAVRMLRRHLTAENHAVVLDRARGRSVRQIELLIAELAPKPDAPTLVRRLPEKSPEAPLTPMSAGAPPAVEGRLAGVIERPRGADPSPSVKPTAPARYRVQCTIGEAAHDGLRRLQALLRREIPDGDPGAIVERALALLLEDVERRKLGATKGRQPSPIRPATDKVKRQRGRTDADRSAAVVFDIRTPPPPGRHIPYAVRRVVWHRDGRRCAYVSSDSHRYAETTFLEFHHLVPYAWRGAADLRNIGLRCRRHNQYEAEMIFGPRAS